MTDAAVLPETENPAATVAAAAARSERLLTPCGDGTMAWRSFGSGPPVVLLHGGHGAWTHWIRNVLPLSARHRVLVPDMPGFGESAAPPNPYTADSLAAILAEGLDIILGEEKFAIVGFSFGGVMGGHLAKARPDRVRRLVMVGSNGMGLARSPMAELQNWKRMEGEAERLAAHRHNLGVLMLHDPAQVEGLALHIQATNTVRTRINSRKISLTDALRRSLSEFPAPLAGIWGIHDATARGGPLLDARAELIRSFDPAAEFVRIDAGHWVPFEAPEAFNAAVLEILASPRSARGQAE